MTASAAHINNVQPELSSDFSPFGLVQVCEGIGWTRSKVVKNSRRLPKALVDHLLAAYDAVNAQRIVED